MLVSDPQMLAPPGKHVITRVGSFASYFQSSRLAFGHILLYTRASSFFTEPYHLLFVSPSDSFRYDFMEKPASEQFN